MEKTLQNEKNQEIKRDDGTQRNKRNECPIHHQPTANQHRKLASMKAAPASPSIFLRNDLGLGTQSGLGRNI